MMRRFAVVLASLLTLALAVWAADPSDPLERIKDEGLSHSQAMSFLSYLVDGIGPRMSGSAGMDRARKWAQSKLAEIGLQNVHSEPVGTAPLDWRLKRFSAQVIEPQCIPLIAFPKWHSPGVPGEVIGELAVFDAAGFEDLEKYRGKLKGKIVLNGSAADLQPSFERRAGRKSDAELLEIANAPSFTPQTLMPPRAAAGSTPSRPAWRPSVIQQFLHDEGVVASFQSSRAPGGTLFVGNWEALQPSAMVGDPAKSDSAREWQANAVPQVVVAAEQYGRLRRMVEMGQTLRVAFQLAVDYADAAPQSNVIAEIPGTDLSDQIVMLGAHLDSWNAGTGATDNAAGVAICMEAVRILKALKVAPRRTIRIALWDAEELTARGSRAYVTEHFGQVETTRPNGGSPVRTLKRGPEYEKLSAYYNMDLGSGKIRGVYLEGNEQLRNIIREWTAALGSLGVSTISAADGGGSDHLRFDQVGLPGLFFIQDDLYYEDVLHTNFDVLERAQSDDLKQAAVVMATFVYQTAMRDERLPRRSLDIGVQ